MFVTGWIAAAGLLAASIPILIHLLLRRRRRPIQWAAMSLLLEASRRQRRRARLEQILLLALRCLILLVAGLAIAQPILSNMTTSGRATIVHLVLDDGIVSSLQDSDGRTAMERHTQEAARGLELLDPGDRVTVTLASRPARMLIEEPTADHRSVARALDTLGSREGATDFAAALDLLAPQLQEVGYDHDVRLLGDFRRGSVRDEDRLSELEVVEGSTLTLTATAPAEDPAGNVQVEAIEVSRNPASTASTGNVGLVQVSVRLRRSGTMPAGRTTVRLEGDAIEPVASRQVEWTPGREEASVEFQAKVDEDGGVLKAIIDPDRLNADDQRLVSVDPAGPIRVLMVDRIALPGDTRLDRLGVSDWIERALDPVENTNGMSAVRIEQTDPANLGPRDLEDTTVLVLARPDLLGPEAHPHIANFAMNGGVVVLVPPTEVVARPWASPLLSSMDVPWAVSLEPETLEEPRSLATQQPDSRLLRLLSGELPALASAVAIDRRMLVDEWNDADGVLVDNEGDAVVLSSPVGAGRLIFFATAPVLEWTDLPVKPLMVPLFHEIVRQGTALSRRSVDGVVGERSPLVRSPAAVAMIDSAGRRISHDQGGDGSGIPDRSGAFTVLDLADTPVEMVVVNPAIGAAGVEPSASAEVENWLGQAGAVKMLSGDSPVEETASVRGSDVAVQLLFLLVSLVLLETLAAKYFSRGSIRRLSGESVRSTRMPGGKGIMGTTP